MSYEKKDGLVLFANEKRTKESQPVMRGFLTFNGTEYEVSLWGNTSPKGTKYWKGTYKEKQERQPEAAPAPTEDFSDEIPF
jgi:hypothetical protein